MRPLIVLLLFVYILSRIMLLLFLFNVANKQDPQNSKQCAKDADINELLVKLKSELEETKEKLRTFEESTNARFAEVAATQDIQEAQPTQLTPSCRQIIQNCMECSSYQQEIGCSLCDPGYVVNGSVCEAKLFSKPPAPPLRGSYSYTGVKYGDTVTYYCEPGYELEGNQNLTCGITGEWGQPPCCIRQLSDGTSQSFRYENLSDESIRQYLKVNLEPRVRVLNLLGNRLTEVSWITEYIQLDTLQGLHVRANMLESFSWEDIPPLTERIDFGYNKLVRLPHISKYNTCVRLKSLGLQNNQIVRIESGQIPHTLETLYMPANKLTSLGDLSHTKLTYLALHINELKNIECDHIPPTVVKLNLYYNELTSTCNLSLHKQLTDLYFSGNELENIECDHIPHTVVELGLSENKLTSLCNFSQYNQLTELHLSYNQLENIECDHIPRSVVKLSLYRNKLTSLCDLSHLQLTELDLSYNQLTTVSAEHLPPSLRTIDLSNNPVNCESLTESLSMSVICQ